MEANGELALATKATLRQYSFSAEEEANGANGYLPPGEAAAAAILPLIRWLYGSFLSHDN